MKHLYHILATTSTKKVDIRSYLALPGSLT